MVEDTNEQQNKNEKLREEIKRRVKFEEIAHYTVENLVLASKVTESDLIELCQLLSPEQYDDIIEERAISNSCGYPICNCKPTEIKKQYHISLKEACVYDVTKRKNFCSSHCYEASDYLRNQIPSTPVWIRESLPKIQIQLLDRSNIKGLIGEIVLEDIRKSLQTKLLKNVSDDFSTNSNSDADASKNNEELAPCSSRIDILQFANNLPNDSDANLHKNIMDILKNKTKNLRPYLDNFFIDLNDKTASNKLIGNSNNIIDNSNKFINPNNDLNNSILLGKDLQSENSDNYLLNNGQVLNQQLIENNLYFLNSENKELDSDDDQILNKDEEKFDTISDLNKNHLIDNIFIGSSQIDHLDDNINLSNIDLTHFLTDSNYNRLERVRNKINSKKIKKSIFISQEVFKSTLNNSYNINEPVNTELVVNNLSVNEKQSLQSELHIFVPLKQCLVEWLNYKSKERQSIHNEHKKSIEYSEKSNNNNDYAIKVRQFFEDTENEKDGAVQIILPNVDSHSQSNIRRQLVYKNIYNSLRCLSKIYGIDINIMSNIKDIVHDFKFSNRNILLNPKQWNLVTLIFIKFLIENKKIELDTREFKNNLNDYFVKINISVKQFEEFYSFYVQII